ncbi:hypothetical protein [Bartonella bacilliformis]
MIVSLIATAWNGVFNFLYDRIQKYMSFQHTKWMCIS